jgi:hypothetical protein
MDTGTLERQHRAYRNALYQIAAKRPYVDRIPLDQAFGSLREITKLASDVLEEGGDHAVGRKRFCRLSGCLECKDAVCDECDRAHGVSQSNTGVKS